MEGTVPWYQSKTIIASFVVLLGSVLHLFGKHIADADQQMLTDLIVTIIQAVAAMVAIYGRTTATAKIG